MLVNSNGNNSRNINDDGCFKRLFDRLTKRGYQTLATFDDEGIYDDDDLVRMVEEEEDDANVRQLRVENADLKEEMATMIEELHDLRRQLRED